MCYNDAGSILQLSPEVQAALAAQELQKMKDGMTELSIFEVVHNKYQERQKNIYGNAGARGVANVRGF